MTGTSFWLVWNESGYPPRYRHDTEDGAVREAERLARTNPGQSFYVLEAVAIRIVDSMQRINLRGGSDDVPF
jgi:hypothetical protein